MKAKEKAIKLVNKFQVELMDAVLMDETQEAIAKECALICVYEKEKILLMHIGYTYNNRIVRELLEDELRELEKVKKEIYKL